MRTWVINYTQSKYIEQFKLRTAFASAPHRWYSDRQIKESMWVFQDITTSWIHRLTLSAGKSSNSMTVRSWLFSCWDPRQGGSAIFAQACVLVNYHHVISWHYVVVLGTESRGAGLYYWKAVAFRLQALRSNNNFLHLLVIQDFAGTQKCLYWWYEMVFEYVLNVVLSFNCTLSFRPCSV